METTKADSLFKVKGGKKNLNNGYTYIKLTVMMSMPVLKLKKYSVLHILDPGAFLYQKMCKNVVVFFGD